MVDENVEPSKVDLVEYVENMLNKGFTFKQIAESLSISDPRKLKRMIESIIVLLQRRCRV